SGWLMQPLWDNRPTTAAAPPVDVQPVTVQPLQPTCQTAKADVKRLMPGIDVFARVETLPLGLRFRADSGIAGAGVNRTEFYYAGDVVVDCEGIVTLRNGEWYRISYVVERRDRGDLYVRAKLGRHLDDY